MCPVPRQTPRVFQLRKQNRLMNSVLVNQRFFLVGGAVQMLLVAVPLSIVCLLIGMAWRPVLLAAAAGALSSTILVFKALAEWGQTTTPSGRRAIGILLFQDVALVPLMLLLPLLTGSHDQPGPQVFSLLVGKSLLFVAAVLVLRRAIAIWVVPMLAGPDQSTSVRPAGLPRGRRRCPRPGRAAPRQRHALPSGGDLRARR